MSAEAEPDDEIAEAVKAAAVSSFQMIPAIRIIPRYPPIEALEEADDPEIQAGILAELATVYPEILGNPDFAPVPPPTGHGATRIITSYTFSRPNRFNDETFAAFYGAESADTAIRETTHHILKALRDSDAPAQALPARIQLRVDVNAKSMVDIRPLDHPWLYDPESYAKSRPFGARIKDAGHCGIVYRSVRRAGGQCVAVYRAESLANCQDERTLSYVYENDQITVSEQLYTTG